MKLHAVGITDIGNVRTENQDSFTIQSAPCSTNGNSLLAVVADGVGGGKAGNIASKIVVDVLTDIYRVNEGNPQEVIRRAIEAANALILERSRNDELCRGMATTCTAMLVKGDTVVIGHVGDSRAYRIRGGEIVHLTEDHTIPRKLFRDGLITEEEIESHPQGNALTNAVGCRSMIDVDITSYEMNELDTYIICSDGLYKYLSDEEFKGIASKAGIEAAPEQFINLAKERGGDDNISVVVVHASSDSSGKTTEILSSYEEPAKCSRGSVGWKTALALLVSLGIIAFIVGRCR